MRPRGGGSGAARAGTTETERTRRRRTAWRTVDPSQFGRRKPSTLRARAWAARQRDWPGEVRNQGDFASENFFGHDVRFCRNRLPLGRPVRPGPKSPKLSDQISDAMLTRPRFRRFFIGSLDLKGELFVESSGIWVKANERNIQYVNMYLQCRVIAYLLKYDCRHVLKREIRHKQAKSALHNNRRRLCARPPCRPWRCPRRMKRR